MTERREPPRWTARWVGLLLVCLAGVVWGTIGPALQVAHERSGLPVLVISAYRGLVAVAVLGLLVVLTGRVTRARTAVVGHRRRIVVVGVLTAAFQLLFFVSVPLAGVSVTTVVCMGFAPGLLLVVTSVRLGRRPTGRQTLTVVMAVAGLLLVTVAGGGRSAASNALLGVLAALAAGAAFGLSADAAGPLSRDLDTLTVTTAVMTVATTVLVPVGALAAAVGHEPLGSTDPWSWVLVAYLGAVTMALAHALLMTGLRSTPSGTAVVATLLEPVTAVLVAALYLGERLTATGFLGSLMIVAAIATLSREEHLAEAPTH